MPDVGVLNLQIQENSEGAIHGLDNLVGALERVKNAVSGGLKLTPVANGLKKLTDIVNENVSGSTIGRLGQLADELAKLKGLGNINIKINGGSSIETILDAVRNTQESMSGINTGFDDIGQRATSARDNVYGFNSAMRETAELMQNKAWGGGIDQFREMFEQYARIRAALSLPAGDQTGISTQVENGWTAWKEGAIEVEGTVSDAMDTVTARLGEPIQYLTGMSSQVENLNDYLGQTNDLMDEMTQKTSGMSSGQYANIPYTGGGVQEEIREVVAETREATKETKVYSETLQEAKSSAETYYASLEDAFNGIRHGKQIENDLMSKWLHGEGTANEQLYAIQQMMQMFGMTEDEVRNRLAELRGEIEQTTNAEKTLGAQTKELSDKAERASWTFSDLKNKIGDLKKGIGNLGLSKLISQFARIAKYRMLRAVLKHITAGFTEGVENVYNYSKYAKTDLAPSMDAAASSLLTMKNSIGAAVAPLLQSLVPVLQSVVNWFIELVNWVNQFIALLRGQSTWTRALPATTNAFDKQTKSAKKAGNAIKELLADWDELNIIQSQSNGSGSGSGLNPEDYLGMFEEVEKFDKGVRNVVDFIKDNFDDILGMAKKVGVALLGWKVSKAFSGLIGDLGVLLAAGATIDLTWEVTTMVDRQYMKTGDEGWLVADALTNLVGATLAGSMVATVLGGAAGLITAGFTLAVSAGISYGIAMESEDEDKKKALADLAIAKGVIGDILLAAGFGIVAGPPGIILGAALGGAMFVISAAVSMVVEQIETAEQIADKAFSETGEGGIPVAEVYGALQAKLDKYAENYNLTLKAFENVPTLKSELAEAFTTLDSMTALVTGENALTKEEADKFKEAWSTVFSAFEGITADSFSTVFTGLNSSLSSEIETIREKGKELRIELLKVQEGMTQAQAQFKVEMEELEGKIVSGTATEEELNRYFEYMEAVAKAAGKSTSALEEVVKEGKGIDFGDEEHVLENVNNFITNAAAAAKTDLDAIDEGVKADIEAIQTLRGIMEMQHTLGLIDDPTYELYSNIFSQTEQNIRDAAEQNKAGIQKTLTEAYSTVLQQAFQGLDKVLEGDGTNGPQYFDAAVYVMRYIAPVIEAIRAAGGEIDEEFASMLGIGANAQEVLRGLLDSNDENDLISWLQKYYAGEVEGAAEALKQTEPPVVEPEIEVKPEVKNISADQISDEIYEAIWDAAEAGTLSSDLIRELADKYGVDLQTVLDNIQPEYQLDETLVTLQKIVEEINKTDKLDLHLPQVKDDGATDKAAEAAGKYEEMARRIRAAFQSLDGLGFSMDLDGTNGSMHVNIPPVTMMATGGMPKSGDLVMANENGSFEMMGRMGSQPVVANNQQIVDGITQGVGNANEDVVSELRGLSTLMQRLLNKELVARAVPDSTWGHANKRSAEALDRVTG